MTTISIEVAAKINPFLQVLAERPDGYHELSLVFQSISIWDSLALTLSDDITLICDHPELPTDRTNLALRAAYLLHSKFPDRGGVKIQLTKRIPIGAGLGGGSADCAAVLVGLNHLWELGLSISELQNLASQLGSDIPFCITGGTAWGRGRGEILTPLPTPDWWVLVCKHRHLSISTAWAYQTYRSGRFVLEARAKSMENWQEHLENDLERAVLPHYPQIARLKETLIELGARALMTGSGAAVFAILPTIEAGQQLAAQITDRFPDVDTWLSQTIAKGIKLAKIPVK
jgi:4-diphosphocytidyl-2-C-methyl-D-erythritol kinase